MNINRIIHIYEHIKCQAKNAYHQGDYNRALQDISLCAELVYNFNWIYSDNDLEFLLREISRTLLSSSEDYIPVPGRIVFFDSFGWANRGLTQQYIRALMSYGVSLLFVYDGEDIDSTKAIQSELAAYGHAEFYAVEKGLAWTERIKVLCAKIKAFAPEKAFVHISPWDTVAVPVMHSLSKTTRYWVNLTDHAFWLGTTCLDYSLEFRSYGSTVSMQKRGLDSKQLLLSPFYPILDCTSFTGFPEEVSEDQDIIIFTGGAFYKMYDEEGVFLELIKRIARIDKRIKILIAGAGNDKPLKRYIRNNRLEKQVFMLGMRKDINHVFAHSDIYLNTYPLAGGLMIQFAAANKIPILGYSPPDLLCNSISSFLIWGKEPLSEITSFSVDAFMQRAKGLLQNKSYRDKEGKKEYDHLITPEEFNKHLLHLLRTHTNDLPLCDMEIDYEKITSVYLSIQKRYINFVGIVLWKGYRWKALLISPSITARFLWVVLKNKFGILYSKYL